MRRFAKDKLELMVLGVYIRFCASAQKCMSDTVGLVRQGAQNTTWYIWLHQPEKSALAEHCSTMGHSINLRGTSILFRTSGYVDCHLKGKTSTHLNKNNFNRGGGFILRQPSLPITCKVGPNRAGTWFCPPTLSVSLPALMGRYIMTQTGIWASQFPTNESRDGSWNVYPPLNHLLWLLARGNFTEFCQHKNFKLNNIL